jgi:hypothetical protein
VAGEYEGINYRYLVGSTTRSGTFLKRRIDNVSIYVCLVRHSVRDFNKDCLIIEELVVLLYSVEYIGVVHISYVPAIIINTIDNA